jgi:hypothetical protein
MGTSLQAESVKVNELNPTGVAWLTQGISGKSSLQALFYLTLLSVKDSHVWSIRFHLFADPWRGHENLFY